MKINKPLFNINGMIIRQFPGYFLVACLIISFIGLVTLFLPFLAPLVLAAVAAVAFHPLYKKILELSKGRARMASLLTCLSVGILIIVPMFVFLFLLGQQAHEIFTYIQKAFSNGDIDWFTKWEKGGWLYDSAGNLRDQFKSYFDINNINLKQSVSDAVSPVSQFFVSQSTSILKGMGWFFIHSFIFFFALYYFFKDSEIIIKKLMIVSPLPVEHEVKLIHKFKEISLATLYGIFLTSIAQGIVCGIGFTIAGIPHAVFWGTATSVFSLVPMVGTATIWLPAGIIWLLSGHVWQGIFMLLWGLLIVSTVDNFLRAALIGSRTNTNQLLTFLAVFGGLAVFGLIGIIYGPLILNLFFTFLHIYEVEYDNVLKREK
jgi:predicted PurR-regulated permease PerM